MLSLKALAVALLPLVASATSSSSELPLTKSKPVPAKTYAACQRKTANPLSGCPPGTIYVSQNDTRADFQSIQEAILSVPNNTEHYVILIGAGVYFEQLNVTRSAPLTLLGQSNRPWGGESYAAVSANDTEAYSNDVLVYHNSANFNVTFSDNAPTAVLTVGPNYNATLTGSGPTGFAEPADTPFGNTDFRAYNIDFHNEQYLFSNGPALALGMGYANGGFYSCGFYSWQDTIYIGKLANAYFYDTIVAGETDFLYGFGTLFIDKSTLALRTCGGGITAWKGTNTTFVNKYGVYIHDSQVLASNASVAAKIEGKCSLGRPWNAEHRSVYENTYLDASILPAGYTPWSSAVNGNIGPNTTMAVWDVFGPGYNQTAEVAGNVTHIFDDSQVQPYLQPVDVFMTTTGKQPNVAWIDSSVCKE
ncbi:pectin methylesterase family protein [Xylariales sp. PMI_506]|nr:pectin methylesterase family protein [Xylariales sp. PMI_506]